MKNKGRIFLTGIIFFVIFVSVSCIPDGRNIENENVTTTLTRSAFPPSATVRQNTPTIAQTISPTLKAESTPSPSPVVTSTINWDERDAKIETLVTTNGGCRFPCFLGISPGKTTWEEAKAILSSLSINSSDFQYTYGISHDASLNVNSKSRRVEGAIQLFEEKGVITIIVFSTDGLTAAKYYSLSDVFKNNGEPDDIGVDLSILGPFGLPDQAHLDLHVSYGNTWLHLYYGQMAIKDKTGNAYKYCPNDPRQNTSEVNFKMILQSRAELYDPETIASKLDGVVVPVPPHIESASNVSVDQFYRNVIDRNMNFCLTSPVKYWKQWFPN